MNKRQRKKLLKKRRAAFFKQIGLNLSLRLLVYPEEPFPLVSPMRHVGGSGGLESSAWRELSDEEIRSFSF